ISWLLLVDRVLEGVLLYPFADPGSEMFESKGLLRLAPLTATTIKSLYSLPYSILAHPEIDSVIISEESTPGLAAQNSAIWSRLLSVVPSFLPEALPLKVQYNPAVSLTEKLQLV